MYVCNIFLDFISKKEVLNRIESSIQEKKLFRIATVNPEFLLMARRNKKFLESLRAATVRVRDGYGIGLMYWLWGRRSPERIAGADLVRDILKRANEKGWSIYVINRKGGLSTLSEIQKVILETYPNIPTVSGFDMEVPFQYMEGYENVKYQVYGFDIVFSSLGAPYQELFLNDIQGQGVRAVLIGVGGSFDFMTGKQRRAPYWVRFVGLEWLFRIGMNPSRIPRIFRAVILFPVIVVLSRLRSLGCRDTLK